MGSEFSDTQYDAAYPQGIDKHWWNTARAKIVIRLCKKYLSTDASVLEVGAGKGVAVGQLREQGIDCFGVELADVSPFNDMQDYVITGVDANSLPIEQREKYKAILLLDVIEHIEDPSEFISQLVISFPDLEYIIVTVPAGQKLWSNYDVYYGHYRRYSTKMLGDICTHLGHKCIERGYFFHLAYFPARVMAMTGINRGLAPKAPSKLMEYVHRFIALCFYVESNLIPQQFIGSSAYACIRIANSD
jgi:hypothetical protein